jgi:integrase
MRKPKNKPVEVVKLKNQSIPVYYTPETKGGKLYKSWTYSYTEAGRRVRRRASSLEGALTGARGAAEQLAEGTGHLRTLTPDEIADFIAAERILRKYPNMRLAGVVSEWEQAMDRLGERGRLMDAVASFVKSTDKAKIPEISVSELVGKFIKAKTAEGLSVYYLSDIERRLKRFADAFRVNVSTILPEEIKLWLASAGSGRNANNLRASIATLFSYARECGYLSRETKHAGELVKRVKEKPAKIGIYTPEELAKILNSAPARFLPAFAIAAFTGLRSTEIFRLDWSMVKLERGHIVIEAEDAKTASRRIVPIVPALAEWLSSYKGWTGRVTPEYLNLDNLTRKFTAVVKAAGVKPKYNAVRHSFASYRLAEVKSADQVALEMGNSPRKLFTNYRELVTEEDAAAWFAVTPSSLDAEKVVSFAA